MDDHAFDEMTRALEKARSRRGAMRLLASGVLAPIIAAGVAGQETAAKGHKHNKRCIRNWHTRDPSGGKSCCSGAESAAPTMRHAA